MSGKMIGLVIWSGSGNKTVSQEADIDFVTLRDMQMLFGKDVDYGKMPAESLFLQANNQLFGGGNSPLRTIQARF